MCEYFLCSIVQHSTSKWDCTKINYFHDNHCWFSQFRPAGLLSPQTNSSPKAVMPRWIARLMVSLSLRFPGRRQQVSYIVPKLKLDCFLESHKIQFYCLCSWWWFNFYCRKQAWELQRARHPSQVQCQGYWRRSGAKKCPESQWGLLSLQSDQWNWKRSLCCHLH